MVSGEVQNDGKIKTISISTKWTLINFTLSIIGSVSGYLAYFGLQTEQDYGTNEEESKEMDGAHQLEAIASSEVEIGHMISPKSSTCKLSKIMVPMRKKAKKWTVPINSILLLLL